MRSPGEFLSGEFLKVKYTCQLSTEYWTELRWVPGPIESTAYQLVAFSQRLEVGILIVGKRWLTLPSF